MSEPLSGIDGPIALVFARTVKRSREEAYKAWVAGFQQASTDVAGFFGASTVGHGAPENEYTSIVRFDSLSSLRAWEESDVRREWLARLPPDTVEGEAEIRRLEGLDFWFTAPGAPAPVAPSQHKMALVLIVIVFLLVSGLTPMMRAVLPGAPPIARSAATVLLQVILMTYVIMPRVTRLLGAWLFSR